MLFVLLSSLFLSVQRFQADAQATVAIPKTPNEPKFTVTEEEQGDQHVVCKAYHNDVPVPFTNGKARSDIVVEDHFRIDSVRVGGIELQHPRVGVLKVSLRGSSIGPRGLDSLHDQSVTLVNRKGKRGANYLFTGFSDEASSPFPDNKDAAPYTGVWTPAQPLRMLTHGPGIKAANGGSSGVWSLLAEDVLGLPEGEAPGAQISAWTLQLCYNAVEETLRQESQEQAFAHFDEDKDGQLSMEEYQGALEELDTLQLPEQELIDMFGQLDRDNNDLLSLKDFLQHHSQEDIQMLKDMLELGTSETEEAIEESSSFLCRMFPNLSLCAPGTEESSETTVQEEEVAAFAEESSGLEGPSSIPQNEPYEVVMEPEASSESVEELRAPRYCNAMPFLPSCRRFRGQDVEETETWTVSAQQVPSSDAEPEWVPLSCRFFPESARCQYALTQLALGPEPEQANDEELEDATAQSISSLMMERGGIAGQKILDRDTPVVYEVLDVLSKASLPNGLLGSKWADIDGRLDLTDKQKQNLKLATIAATVGWSTFLIKKLEHLKDERASKEQKPSDKVARSIFIGPEKCSCDRGYPKDSGCLLFDWQCRPSHLSEGKVSWTDYLSRFNRMEGMDIEIEEIDGPEADAME